LFFSLDEKNQKSSQPKCFFAARGLCPANQVKPRATFFCPASLALAFAQCKIPDALSLRTMPSVLPAFTRSCSADASAKNKILQSLEQSKKAGNGRSGRAAGSFACVVAAIVLT
jgi:hypothetical protein